MPFLMNKNGENKNRAGTDLLNQTQTSNVLKASRVTNGVNYFNDSEIIIPARRVFRIVFVLFY